MSYKAHLRRGKEQWENWTRGLKRTTETYGRDGRQAARREVHSLKKATHRAERIASKRFLRAELELLEA